MSKESTWVGIRILEVAITERQNYTYNLKDKSRLNELHVHVQAYNMYMCMHVHL